jgi:dTDP-4-amino-4,6-dideoxygalactose transaminase
LRSLGEQSLTDIPVAARAEVTRARPPRSRFRYERTGNEPSVVAELESAMLDYTGARWALAVNSCSSALLLALRAAGVEQGEVVLCPAFTFVAVPSAIALAGGEPVLVECTRDYVIDVDDLERKLVQTGARWLLLSYMRGLVPDLGRILELCSAHGVGVIEDAAHAIGVLFDGRQVGTFGLAGAFSFQSYKLLDSGEGGLLVTEDDELAARAAVMSGCYEGHWRDHGSVPGERVAELVNTLPMFNMRMTNPTAAVLLEQLPGLQAKIERYETIYQTFADTLADVRAVRFPDRHPRVSPVSDSVQFELVGLGDAAAAEFARAAARLLPALRVIGLDTTNARRFTGWTFVRDPYCPTTEALLERTVDFRLSHDWSVEQAERLAEDLRRLLSRAGR